MNIKEIKEVIALMNENHLIEIEIEKDGTKIRLRKSGSEIVHEVTAPVNAASAAAQQQAAPAAAQQQAEAESKFIQIKAPMVGTFYRAPAPDAASYIEIGQDIEVGQVLCIIEAMKLMNEIKSEVKGKVARICVENADPVEYGQVLFLVEPK